MTLEIPEFLQPFERPALSPNLSPWDRAQDLSRASFLVGASQVALQEANSDWPTCKHCSAKELLIAQIDLEALPPPLAGAFGPGLLRLFACLGECYEPDADARVALASADALPKLVFPETTPVRCITGWEAFPDLPDWSECADELEPKGIKYKDVRKFRPERGDKLGGWATWGNLALPPAYPECPACGQPARRMVCQLVMATENDYQYEGWVFQCPEHPDRPALVACGE